MSGTEHFFQSLLQLRTSRPLAISFDEAVRSEVITHCAHRACLT